MEEKILDSSQASEKLELKTIKKGELLDIEISDLVYGGKGMAKVETENGRFVIFVPNAVPGQKLQVRIVKKQKNHAEGRLIKILKDSPLEIKIPYQAVSGAPYARLPLDIQHSYKKRNTLDQFIRIGQTPDIEDYLDEFISAPDHWHYRNKMEFNFSSIVWNIGEEESHDGFGFGFKKRGCWWAAENLDSSSGLFDKEFENRMKDIRQYLESTGLSAYHPVRHFGFYRVLQVKKSFRDNGLLINLSTTNEGVDKFSLVKFHEFLEDLFPGRIKGLIHSINDSVSDRMSFKEDQKEVIGESFIVEDINGLEFQINSYSFFQTNPKSAEKLYSKVVDYVFEDQINGEIMDLFCGTGTIAQLMAKRHKDHMITGVELVKTAVEDAKMNAKRNNITNVQFIAADVGEFLKEHPEYVDNVEVIVLDPPRGGISKRH